MNARQQRLLMALLTALAPTLAAAELPALVNYESKADQKIRYEGLAIIELDPSSPDYGRVLKDIRLPPTLVAHHVYYNPDRTRGYITSLGKRELRTIDLTRHQQTFRPDRVIPLPDCEVGEDMVFSATLQRWYLTCLGSSKVVVGDLRTDEVLHTVDLPAPWPHGINLHEGIDRLLVTSTISPDGSQTGEEIVELRLSTLEVLARHKVSNNPSPSGAAPVEVIFVPDVFPPVAYITNLGEATLWKAAWQPASQTFSFEQVDDFGARGQGVPLEVYFNHDRTRAFVTTGSPGHLNVYDISNPHAPVHLQAIDAAAGAHHAVFSPDERYAFVQNSLLNLEGLSDGSISVIDLVLGQKVGSIDVLKDAGFTPNSIILLPGFDGGGGH